MYNNSSFANSTQGTLDTRDETLAKMEITVLGLIFVLAIVGNAFILYALLQQRKVRPWSRIYVLMAQLSVADVLVALLNILPQLIWDITFRFRGGNILCKGVKYGQVFVLYLSTNMLLVMSFDRYLVVNRPGQWNNPKVIGRLILSAWTLSAIFALPQMYFFSYREIEPSVHDCWADFGLSSWAQRLYVLWFTGTVFIVPLAAIVALYGAICIKIWRYRPVGQACAKYSAKQSVQIELQDIKNSPLSTAKLKTIKLTLVITICFVICWSPFCFSQLYLAFWPPLDASEVGPIHTILLLLASLNSCCNPWIYLAFSESLTDHLKGCLHISRTEAPFCNSVGDQDDFDGHGQPGGQRSQAEGTEKNQVQMIRLTATTATI
ncbi:Vasopressin V1a receptor [Halotydeus destructor]|nr:Vasopressin V1a receptor [Halotydeus destructor]